jgi:ferritin-like metal-binding protein YciE
MTNRQASRARHHSAIRLFLMTWSQGSARSLNMTDICDTLRDLYVRELRTLFSAEVLLLHSWQNMSDRATTPALRQTFSAQVRKSHIHLAQLEHIFEDLSQTATEGTCAAMAAMVVEVQHYLEAGGDSDVRDAALITATRKIHHYKAGAYASVSALAFRLGDTGAATRLGTMLADEHAADQELAKIAESSVNLNAGNPAKAKAEFDVSIF